MLLDSLKSHLDIKPVKCFLLAIFVITCLQGFSQSSHGVLKGRVTDGSTNKPLFGVFVSSDLLFSATFADGSYSLAVPKGDYTVEFKLQGFQKKAITNVSVQNGETSYLDIILFPVLKTGLMNKKHLSDSLANYDSLISLSFYKESRSRIYNPIHQTDGSFDVLNQAYILPGTDKDGSQLLKRLNNVIVQENQRKHFLNISGLGERYNQVLMNGSVLNSIDPVSRAYPLAVLPAEILESVSVQTIPNAATPADFAGGTVEIRTRDLPDQNFFYVLTGTGFSGNSTDRDFLGDKKNKWQTLSFPGSMRDLPAEFPTTRSQSSFQQKNIQEQVYLSKQLKNNLGPVNYGSSNPDHRAFIGVGRIIPLKDGRRIGIIAFLNHQKWEIIEESSRQVVPEIAANPYPFSENKVLIRSRSNDISYQYTSQVSATLNASFLFGRNKISLRNFLARQFLNTYVQRSGIFKPDEDTLAHSGINYQTEQRTTWNTQLSGEHALGENSRLKINWLASYTFYGQLNPDERNFLLRQDVINGNLFEIARPSAASLSSLDDMFTNTARLWRDYKDHNFTGSFNMLFPFNLFRQAQVLSGGIYIQTRYRIFFSDLLFTKGTGYFPLNDLLSATRYFPGGLNVANYYTKFIISGGIMNPDAVNPTHRGNYTASANLGASYLRFENKITKQLSLDWGIRVESNSQLVSSSQYNYFTGYKNAQLGTLDENDRVIDLDFLPSAQLKYQLTHNIQMQAAFSKTINRPQLQELARYRYYDAVSFMVKTGNPLLANTEIMNYNAGVSWLPNAGTHVSVSGFYKDIDQPIEYILSGYANSGGNLLSTPHNTPPATIRGLTAAFKVNLDFIAYWLSPVSIFANGNWLESKVSAGPIRSGSTPDVSEHPLSGSPEYSMNAGLVIQHPRLPMLTILYNRMSDYISAVASGRKYLLSNGNQVSAIPEYRVKGRNQLDIQVSQKLFRSRFQIIAGVNDLLNSPYIIYQDLNGNKKFDSALTLTTPGNSGGFFQSGIDNTVVSTKSQRCYYVTVSYIFK